MKATKYRILTICIMVFIVMISLMPKIQARSEGESVTSGLYRYAEILDDNGDGTGKVILQEYLGTEEDVVIPEQIDDKDVVETTSYAFYNNPNIKTITLPSTLKKVFAYTFYSCENLETINFPDTVEVIDKFFYGACNNLTDYTIPSHLEELGKKLNISYVNVSTVTLQGAYKYDLANEIIELINEARVKEGLTEYELDEETMNFCLTRAPELAIYLGHERPCGLSTQSLVENQRIPCNEIIGAGQETAEEVVNQWLDSQFHRPTIMSEEYVQCGAACYLVDGSYYWIFAATAKGTTTEPTEELTGTEEKDVDVKIAKYYNYANIIEVEGLEENNTLNAGETLQPLSVLHKNIVWGTALLQPGDITWKSSDEDIFTVDENGKITAGSKGTATLFVSLLNSTLEYKITVEGSLPTIELSLPNLEEVEIGGTVEYTLNIYDAEEIDLKEEDITVAGVTADISIKGNGNEKRTIILSNIQGEAGAQGYISLIAEGIAINDLGTSKELNITTGKFAIKETQQDIVPEKKQYKGDINKDGLVDSADAAIALNLYKYNNATDEELKIGDMDDNNIIDSADAAIILNHFKYNQKIEM